jgi:hypothetical protein
MIDFILFKFLKVNFVHAEIVFMRSLHQWIFVIAIKFVPVIQQRCVVELLVRKIILAFTI